MQLQKIIPYVVAAAFADINAYDRVDSDLMFPFAQFESMDAQFGPRLSEDGLFGKFFLAEPNDACSPVNPAPFEPFIDGNRTIAPLLIVKRGVCEFDIKVLTANQAGYSGVIVYNNIPSNVLIPMGSESDAIKEEIDISSVFTTLEAGIALLSFLNKSRDSESAVYINIVSNGNSPFWPPTKFLWPFAAAVGGCLIIMLVSTVVKLVRDWRKSRRGRLSRRKLNQLPIIKFIQEEHGERFECCAICLEEFKNGDKIRELPCKHGYHKQCIDPWLTANRKVCPLCKRTVLPSDDSDDSDSEEAPLLRNERVEHQNEDEVRVVGWARGLAEELDNPNQADSPDRERRNSITSYQSTGEINEAFAEQNTVPQTETRPIPSSLDDTDTNSNDGDDEQTPRTVDI